GALGRNPSIASDTFSTNLGFIRYKGLLVDLRKRLSRGIQGGLAYTLSKTEDNGLNFASVIQVPSRPDLNSGPSTNDRRHEVKAHLEVELPFDIQWAGILEHYSEAPLNVNAARDINGDGLLNDWVNEEICRTVSCPGLHYSRNSVRELSTEDANQLDMQLPVTGGGAPSPADASAPSAPGTLTATASGSTQVNLAWGAATDNVGVTGYRVERCAGSGCSDTTLSASTSYSYRVRAADAAGNLGTYSNTAGAITSGIPPVVIPPTGTSPGLVAAYGFSEGSGATTADASGNGNSGRLSGTGWTAAGHSGNALSFNGSGAFVDLGNAATLQLSGSMTVSAWIRAAAFPFDDAAVVSKRTSDKVGFQLDTTIDTGPRTIGFKLTT